MGWAGLSCCCFPEKRRKSQNRKQSPLTSCLHLLRHILQILLARVISPRWRHHGCKLSKKDYLEHKEIMGETVVKKRIASAQQGKDKTTSRDASTKQFPTSSTRKKLRQFLSKLMLLLLAPFVWLYKAILMLGQKDPRDYTPPSMWVARLVAAPFRWLMPTTSFGLENVPTDRPVLFVGNHTLYAWDMTVLAWLLFSQKGIMPRGLADTFHWLIPGHKHFLQYFGAVVGTRENCSLLMEQRKHSLLVYPGGADEVLHTKEHVPYSLIWKERTGFARLAAQHDYEIVTVASVGTEEMFKIWFDLNVSRFLAFISPGDKRSEQGFSVPVPKPYLRPQRVYFKFGRPIRPTGNDDQAIRRPKPPLKHLSLFFKPTARQTHNDTPRSADKKSTCPVPALPSDLLALVTNPPLSLSACDGAVRVQPLALQTTLT
eukprot:g14166.t1